jgi:hypothetical protein
MAEYSSTMAEMAMTAKITPDIAALAVAMVTG